MIIHCVLSVLAGLLTCCESICPLLVCCHVLFAFSFYESVQFFDVSFRCCEFYFEYIVEMSLYCRFYFRAYMESVELFRFLFYFWVYVV